MVQPVTRAPSGRITLGAQSAYLGRLRIFP